MTGMYLEKLKNLVLNHFSGYKVKIYLFGSYARGSATHVSDVDIGILPLEPISNQVFVEIRDKIEESKIPYFVDIVNMNDASKALKEQILTEGIVWKD